MDEGAGLTVPDEFHRYFAQPWRNTRLHVEEPFDDRCIVDSWSPARNQSIERVVGHSEAMLGLFLSLSAASSSCSSDRHRGPEMAFREWFTP